MQASALLSLSSLTSDKELGTDAVDAARRCLHTLALPEYLAEPGTNGVFLLKHSVGSYPSYFEVDVPLTYADYYFLEAINRLVAL